MAHIQVRCFRLVEEAQMATTMPAKNGSGSFGHMGLADFLWILLGVLLSLMLFPFSGNGS
jgi:hypothetical protein